MEATFKRALTFVTLCSIYILMVFVKGQVADVKYLIHASASIKVTAKATYI